jgi:hypothetical protein
VLLPLSGGEGRGEGELPTNRSFTPGAVSSVQLRARAFRTPANCLILVSHDTQVGNLGLSMGQALQHHSQSVCCTKTTAEAMGAARFSSQSFARLTLPR